MVCNDADEMEKILIEVFDRMTVGTDLPGAVAGSAPAPVPTSEDDDDKPVPSRRMGVRTSLKQILSDDDEYFTPSDEE